MTRRSEISGPAVRCDRRALSYPGVNLTEHPIRRPSSLLRHCPGELPTKAVDNSAVLDRPNDRREGSRLWPRTKALEVPAIP